MAVITGKTGGVTFAGGYTTGVHAWSARPSSTTLDTTGFAPTNDYMTRAAGLADWQGSYTCWMRAVATSAISGAGYLPNPYRLEAEIACQELPATKFTDTYVNRVAGLLSSRGSWSTWIDTTTVLGAGGATGTLTVTASTGATYAVPIIVESVDYGLSADGNQRSASVSWIGSGAVTATGLPVAGVTGAATFTANTSRTLSGNILITRVRLALSADREEGEFTFDWVGTGTMTPA